MEFTLFIYGENGFTNNTLAASLSIKGFKVIGETDKYEVASDLISKLQPDVLILTIDYKQLKSIELANLMRRKFPKLGIVILSRSHDFRLFGISEKDLPIGVLAAPMINHGDLDSLELTIKLAPFSTKSKSDFPINKNFTDTQIETIRLLAEGHANSEIAKQRFVTEKSVEQMLSRIAMELGITFDFQHNSRVRILNSFYMLVNGRS